MEPLLSVAKGTNVFRQALVPSFKAPSAIGPKTPDVVSTIRHLLEGSDAILIH